MRITDFHKVVLRNHTAWNGYKLWEWDVLRTHCLKEAFKVGMPRHYKAFYLQMSKIANYKIKHLSK